MKKETQRKYILTILIALICLLSLIKIRNNYLDNKKILKEEEGIIALQFKEEQKFKTKGYTIDKPNVILDPYKKSPLTALVLFETKNAVAPQVIVKGKDEHSTFKFQFKKGKTHYLEILGLYPNKENEVIISYQDQGKKVTKPINIKTSALPTGFILPTSVSSKRSKLGNDLYFMSPSAFNLACAYDINGDVRWYFSNVGLWENARLKIGHMMISTPRLINMPYYVTGLLEIDLLGKVYNEYSLPGGYHHDYFEMPNGNLLVASNDFYNEFGTVEDYIVELDRQTGKIIKTFDLKDVLKMDDGKSSAWSSFDWFHNNSVWYDQKTNSITLSGRHKDAVINIDYESGKLNWIIGDVTNWSKEYQKYFFKPIGENFEWQWAQHAAMITPENYVFLLDNGNNKSKIKEKYVPAEKSYTRGVMYKIDPKKMTIEQVWQYGKERGNSFYSPYISDVDYLAKNHYLIHSGGISYLDGKISNVPAGLLKGGKVEFVSDTVEILNDEVIFEIKLPTNNYRAEKMPLYNETRLELGKGKELGSLGKTKITKVVNKKPKTIKIDANYKKHLIKWQKEKDRLTLAAQFKTTDDVKIILNKGFKSYYYKLNISKRPYTALCVDVFTEEETANGIMINRAINEEGLKGKYKIFIEINGKTYNTNKIVRF